MNKISLIITLIALTVMPSFSQNGIFKFGVRAGFNLYNVFWEGKPPGIGMGYAGGIVANIPSVNSLAFNSELNFLYRNLYNHELKSERLGVMKESITEFAIGIPIMIQYTPVSQVPFYLTSGVQLNIPLSSELTQEMRQKEETSDYDNRPAIDFGIALGLGYYITENLAVDFKGVIDLTSISTKKDDNNPPINPFNRDKTWLLQYGLGVSYFF